MQQPSIFKDIGHSQELPLAEKARPISIQDLIGQEHLLAPGSWLRAMLEKDDFGSFILWGPPGSGKTTIARIIAKHTRHTFCSCSAVHSKIAEVKSLMEQAACAHRLEHKKTIVFIDLKFPKNIHAAIFMSAAVKVFTIDLRGNGQTN
jgi:putative ATPase